MRKLKKSSEGKGIYFELVPVGSSDRAPTGYAGIDAVKPVNYHAYLVYRDGEGGETVIRGGPDDSTAMGQLGPYFGGADIVIETGKLQDSSDAYDPSTTPADRYSQKLDLGGRPPEDVRAKMEAKAKAIGQSEIDYNVNIHTPTVDMQNSNSVVRAVLEESDVDAYESLPDWVDPEEHLPGFENDLSTIDDNWGHEDGIEGAVGAVSDFKDAVSRALEDGRRPPDGSVAIPPYGDNAPDGGGGDGVRVPEGERSAPEAPAGAERPAMRPDAEALMAEAARPLPAVREVLLRPEERWSEADLRTVMKDRAYFQPEPEDGDIVRDRVGRWFAIHHGDRPHRTGFPNRTADDFLRRPPAETEPALSADGAPFMKALSDVARDLVARAGTGAVAEPVKDLQEGLNALTRRKAPKKSLLKTDGIFGPKTKSALAETLVEGGSKPTEEAIALGGLKRSLTDAAADATGKSLDDAVDRTITPLFEAPKKKTAEKTLETAANLTPAPWRMAFQSAVDRSGGGAVKKDGILGPKTGLAAHTALGEAGPDALTDAMGEELGFL